MLRKITVLFLLLVAALHDLSVYFGIVVRSRLLLKDLTQVLTRFTQPKTYDEVFCYEFDRKC